MIIDITCSMIKILYTGENNMYKYVTVKADFVDESICR